VARRPVGTLRKRPRQRRAHETVERIINAASRILEERGYDGATTNAIAERAAVSPGSLYQYFLDKDAIVAAVLERFVEELLEVVTDPRSAVYRPSHPDFGLAVTRVLVVLESHPSLLWVLLNEVPRLGPDDAREVLNRRVFDGFRMAMLAADRDTPDLEARCWAAGSIARTLPVRYVLETPDFSREQLVTALNSALSALVEG
jgi:AcrR family transcriptional regulator